MCREYNREIHVAFIDFLKAYDSIKRKMLYKAMENLNIPKKLIKLVQMTLKSTTNKVKWKGRTSESFYVTSGVRQGDPLSTILFNIVLEHVIRRSRVNRTGSIISDRYQCIAYADDLVLVTNTKADLIKIIKNVEEKARETGLHINDKKSKYMVMKNQQSATENQNLIIERQGEEALEMEKVETFTYLGVQITEDGREDEEIKTRLMRGDKAAGTIAAILKSKFISRKAKIQIYKTVLRPIVTYGCEVWKLNVTNETKLLIWERKILRRIYGGQKEHGEWRRRTNRELTELYRVPTIAKFVKQQRIRWLGHVQRMDNSRMTKIVLKTNPIGIRARGRPRSRWKERVMRDLRELGVEDWRKEAADRGKWKQIIQAMGRHDL